VNPLWLSKQFQFTGQITSTPPQTATANSSTALHRSPRLHASRLGRPSNTPNSLHHHLRPPVCHLHGTEHYSFYSSIHNNHIIQQQCDQAKDNISLSKLQQRNRYTYNVFKTGGSDTTLICNKKQSTNMSLVYLENYTSTMTVYILLNCNTYSAFRLAELTLNKTAESVHIFSY